MTLLTLVVAALLGLASLAAVASHRLTRAVPLGSAALCGAGASLVAWTLIDGGEPVMQVLPFGPPGAPARLVLDPLGACFLLLIFVAGAPCAVFAHAERTSSRLSRCALPATLAALSVTALAADPFTLVGGLALLGASGWAAAVHDPESGNAIGSLRVAAFGVACLIVLFAIAGAADYAAMRAAPPSGWRADIVLALALLSTAALIALSSHRLWPDRAVPDTSGPLMALTGGAGAAIGIYLLLRLLFDLCGAAQPSWWSVPLLVAGAVLAVAGALRAALDANLDASLFAGSLQQVGLAIIGLGVAQIARTSDLPTLAVLAMSATWLQMAGLVVCRTLLLLCAAAAQDAAATRRLDRLGGLIHRMPVTAVCMLTGLFGVVALPVGMGFAAFWLLIQSLLSAARVGGFPLQVLVATIAGSIALSMGLAIMAAVRLFGVAFLGRPRTPRTAAAEEIMLPRRTSLICIAALTGLLGLLPGLVLLPARPALSMLTGAAPNGGWLLLMLGSDQAGYGALPIAMLLAFAGAAMLVWLSRRGVAEHRREPTWSGGFAAPPAWLPFGDPATQISAASFAEPVRGLIVTLAKARVQDDLTPATLVIPDLLSERALDPRLREHDGEAAGLPRSILLRRSAESLLRVMLRRLHNTDGATVQARATTGVAGLLVALTLLLVLWLVVS